MSTLRLLTRMTIGNCAFNHGLQQRPYQLFQRPSILAATIVLNCNRNSNSAKCSYCTSSTCRYTRPTWNIVKISALALPITPNALLAKCRTFGTKKPDRAGKSESKASAAVTGTELFGEASKLGIFAKFKLMYKKYWYVMVPVHLVTSLGWFGGFYYMSKSGVDIAALLQYIHLSEAIIEKVHGSDMGHLAVAYLCYKVATPLRYAVTLGGTTVSIKYLVQSGYIKPLPSKQEFIKMYEQKKADFAAAKAEDAVELESKKDSELESKKQDETAAAETKTRGNQKK